MVPFRRSVWQLLLCVLIAIPVVFVAGLARADRKEEAHQASNRGDRAFAKGEYDKALEEYQASYGKYAKPYLLFRIAECQRLLGKAVEAAETYAKFVGKVSRGPDRAKAQAYLKDLQPAVDAAKAAANAPPAVEEKPVPQAGDTEAPPMTAEELAKKRLEDEKRARALRASEPKVTTSTAPKSDTLPPGYDPANLVPDPTDPPSPEDLPQPKPLYKKWWLWTIVGGVAVVGVAVGVGLAFGLPKFQSELPVGGPGARALTVSF